MAQNRLQLLKRAAACVAQVDFMVQVVQPLALLLSVDTHALEGSGLLISVLRRSSVCIASSLD